ncbi:MAG: hypothetical protein CTY16_00060 [Methylobacter sp.]|nr:MAG: hypothetical protein CTY16_00060 [Methylobacter sp.]
MATFRLTTNVDNFVGGFGNDTFKGTYNDGATGTWSILDALNGGDGIDTLNIIPIGVAAITPNDSYWSHIKNIEKIVINTTVAGAQTITTGAFFEAAFAAAGINLKTTSGAGAITVNMGSFTGSATLNTISTDGAQAITTGTGFAAISATSVAGALTLNGAGLAIVKANTTGGGAQTIGDAIGGGAHLVTVTASSGGGAQTITSTAINAVTVTAKSTAGVQSISTDAGADVITASTAAAINTINSGAGNDKITILASATGSYTIKGGAGDDLIKSGVGNDSINGGNGNDILNGGAGNDTLKGGSGKDMLDGGSGIDSMSGGAGSDRYDVDNANDTVHETDTNTSTGGSDMVRSYLIAYSLPTHVEIGRVMLTGVANLSGNGLNNALHAGAGNNVLDGGAGNDTVGYTYGATSAVTVNLAVTVAQATGGSGSDRLVGIENLIGSNYNDTLIGNTGANGLNGGRGADTLIGGNGSDRYSVDNINDVVTETNATASTGGIDLVNSSLSAYSLGANVENGRVVSTGIASLSGNSLNNLLYAGAGNNILDGGSGSDTVSYIYASSAITVSLAVTAAQATGGSGSDKLVSIEKLVGSNYGDTLIGNAGANVLKGAGGADTLTGGGGKDSFDFNALSEMGILGNTRDVITDFVRGQDKIDLSTLDANTATIANDAFTGFIANGASFTLAGQLMMSNGVLYGNTDADNTAEFAIQLTGITTLATSDMVL